MLKSQQSLEQRRAIEVTASWNRDSEEYDVSALNRSRAICIRSGWIRKTPCGHFQTTGRLPRHISNFYDVLFDSLEDAIRFQVRLFGCRQGFWLEVFEEEQLSEFDGPLPGVEVERRWIEGGAS